MFRVEVDHLTVQFKNEEGVSTPVADVSLQVQPGEILALVGESGSGKTMTARALLGLLPEAAQTSGLIYLNGVDVLHAPAERLRQLRGGDAAMVFQEPSTALNPVFTVGWQLEEGLLAHGMKHRAERRSRAIEMMRAVGIPDPEQRVDYYPHQFSGGQKQRIIIAMALALSPDVIIADEPTTALDVTVQAEILDLLRSCRDQLGISIVLITHNMGVVADLADRVAVMRHGQVVECAPVDDLFARPTDPYTQRLLEAVPKLGNPREWNPQTRDEQEPVVSLESLQVTFSGGLSRKPFKAVDGVSLKIQPGEILGLVGESGSGKSTIGRAISGLQKASSGELRLFGKDLSKVRNAQRRELRKRVGVVFQDPAASFNPYMSVEESISEPMAIHGAYRGADRSRRVRELLESVELPASYARRAPTELSGGQRQRVGIARALALQPEMVIADEPTSALDVSVQAKVLDLLRSLHAEHGFAMLFITHDLAVVEQVADRIGVLQRGRLVEIGESTSLLANPQSEYTRALIDAVPVPDPIVQRMRRAEKEHSGFGTLQIP